MAEVGDTLMLAPVMPLSHFTVPVQPVAVSVTSSPLQMVSLLAVSTGATGVPTLIITALEAPLAQVEFVVLQMAV